jgi:hypothetical protein
MKFPPGNLSRIPFNDEALTVAVVGLHFHGAQRI